MAKLVVHGATLTCSEGLAPATLAVTVQAPVQGASVPGATIMDYVPMSNIPGFGMCKIQSNPAVAAATAAALGTPTPAPCVPATTSPWTSAAIHVKLAELAALTSDSTCMCSYGGRISVIDPGQGGVEIE
jgi:hypothetical protein